LDIACANESKIIKGFCCLLGPTISRIGIDQKWGRTRGHTAASRFLSKEIGDFLVEPMRVYRDRIGVKPGHFTLFRSADIQNKRKPLASCLFRNQAERIRWEGEEGGEGVCHAVERNRQHDKEEHKGKSTVTHEYDRAREVVLEEAWKIFGSIKAVDFGLTLFLESSYMNAIALRDLRASHIVHTIPLLDLDGKRNRIVRVRACVVIPAVIAPRCSASIQR
jgi:hypothetical protein